MRVIGGEKKGPGFPAINCVGKKLPGLFHLLFIGTKALASMRVKSHVDVPPPTLSNTAEDVPRLEVQLRLLRKSEN